MINLFAEALGVSLVVASLLARNYNRKQSIVQASFTLPISLALVVIIPLSVMNGVNETFEKFLEYFLSSLISISILRLGKKRFKSLQIMILLAGLVLLAVFSIQNLPFPIDAGSVQLIPLCITLLNVDRNFPLFLFAGQLGAACIAFFTPIHLATGFIGPLLMTLLGAILQQLAIFFDLLSKKEADLVSRNQTILLHRDFMANINRIMLEPQTGDILYRDMANGLMSISSGKGCCLFLLSTNQDHHVILKATCGMTGIPPQVFKIIDPQGHPQPGDELALVAQTEELIFQKGQSMDLACQNPHESRGTKKCTVLPLVHGTRAYGFFLLFDVPQTSALQVHKALIQEFVSTSALAVESMETFSRSSIQVSAQAELGLSRFIHNLCMKRSSDMIQLPNGALTFRHQSVEACHADYVDYLLRKDGKICAIISDTAGSGIESALVTFLIRSLFQLFGPVSDRSPAEILMWMNRALWRKLKLDRYLNTIIFCWDTKTGQLTYASAGSVNAFITRAESGPAIMLSGEQTILGLTPDTQYEDHEFKLDTGDLLVSYTDGMVETRNGDGCAWGLQSLMNQAQASRHLNVSDICNSIFLDLEQFQGPEAHEQTEERSVLLLKIHTVT